MSILDKIKLVFGLGFTIGPAILNDVEGSIKKIEADTTLKQRVHDILDGLIAVMQEVAKVL